MPRRVRELRDVEIDEISLVDVPANQFAKVAIAKRATEEATVPELDTIYNEAGDPLEFDSLQEGDVVFDGEGNPYLYTEDETPVEETAPELAEVGKSLREELSKSFGVGRDETIAKALRATQEAESRAARAEEIAKAERDLRLTREYVEVAKGYNIPVDPDELGPVLMRMAESMTDEDCAVVHKALSGAGEALFAEVGFIGGGDNVDVMSQVDAALDEAISKADGKVSKAAAMEEYFLAHPEAYDEYVATQGGR